MCLHRNRVTRDAFYNKLQGNGVEELDAEKYALFESTNSEDLKDSQAAKTADGMYNLKKTMDQIAAKDTEIANMVSPSI